MSTQLHSRPISRRQFYYYAMKLKDRIQANGTAPDPYWNVKRLDDFLRQVDCYCFVHLQEVNQAVQHDAARWRGQLRGWMVTSGAMALAAILATCVLSANADVLVASRIGAGLFLLALAAAIMAWRAWGSFQQRAVLLVQLTLWEQALAEVSTDESMRVFGASTPWSSRRSYWHSTWN